MDKITESLVKEFLAENGLSEMSDSEVFEHFVAFTTIQRLHGETFDTSEVVLGNSETGIDGIAILVNGVLVSDIDALENFSEASNLDVSFIFVQADRSNSFDAGKIGNIVFAVRDFFRDDPKLPRTERLNELAKIQQEIFKKGSKFKKANPSAPYLLI